jgi:phosphate transport system substrate-binding protein
MLKSVMRMVVALALVASSTFAMAEEYLDPQLPVYRPVDKLEGKISLIGSDTMSQVVAVWKDSFKKFYPNVEVTIAVKGATNAIPSVMKGEATIGMLSREATHEEIEVFTAEKKYAPKLLVPSLERIGVYVSECNPIESLTLAQVDAIFSTTRKRGEAKEYKTWGDLSVPGQLAKEKITLRGRSATTGSQGFFQAVVLQGGEFHKEMIPAKDNLTLVKEIAADPTAIGFSGEIYQIPGIRAVPIAVKADEPAYAIDSLGDEHGTYPIIRPLQFVIDQAPDKELPEAEREFLKYVFSKSGQEDVVKAGFHPISSAPARTALGAVGLNTLN